MLKILEKQLLDNVIISKDVNLFNLCFYLIQQLNKKNLLFDNILKFKLKIDIFLNF